jgi:hypothetical protein
MEEDVYLGEDLFRLRFPLPPEENESAPVVVTISLMEESYGRLHWNCTACESLCEHIGAAFSLILDEKMALGLAAPPPERVQVESLDEQELIERAIEEWRERGRVERMIVKSIDPLSLARTRLNTISGILSGGGARAKQGRLLAALADFARTPGRHITRALKLKGGSPPRN